jgi:Rieske 2Fe-2S family protein
VSVTNGGSIVTTYWKSVPYPCPISAGEVANVRQPTERASTLPARAYHDSAVFDWEREAIFAQDWLYAGRADQAAGPGDYFLTAVNGQNLVIVRGDDNVLRAFHNVCRHRGATIVQEPCGQLVRFQCPYHAWVYDLQGKLRAPRYTSTLEEFDPAGFGLYPVQLETWQGMVFVSLSPEPVSFAHYLGDLPGHFSRYQLDELRLARRLEYDVAANWKIVAENFSECYHCPGVHPLLNHLTPYNLGENLPGDGLWSGAWMILTGGSESMSIDGKLHQRPLLPGTRPEDRERVYYAWVWPSMLLTVQPECMVIHQVVPVNAERSLITCDLFFHPEAIAAPGFDPSGPAEFWDLTNREDWHVCELQQRGTASMAWTPGRYSAMEGETHKFDALVADRYANDGVRTIIEVKAKAELTATARSQPDLRS